MTAHFDPPVFRYTVRTPESRHAALRERASRVGMTPGQLVQALFDCIDLSRVDGDVGVAIKQFNRLYPQNETTREFTARANSVGLTGRELKVFRALANLAGEARIVRPNPMDVTARSNVPHTWHDTVYDRLIEKGFLAIAPSTGRGMRAFRIARIPEL